MSRNDTLQAQISYDLKADRERRIAFIAPSSPPIIEGIPVDLKFRDPFRYIEILEREVIKHMKKLSEKNQDINGLWMINDVQGASLRSYRQQVLDLQAMLKSRLDPQAYRHVFPFAHKD